jgi:hypothetical protein
MQISDVQDTTGLLDRTRALLVAVLESEKPDFVVFTGDQIKGYGLSLLLANAAQRHARITATMDELLTLLQERNIPFTITFGNHDHDAPMPGKKQIDYYQQSPLCLTEDSPADVPGFANHTLQVLSSHDDAPALQLYFLDSHGSKGLGYAPLQQAQLDWYRAVREATAAQNNGKYVPSLLFQHVPIEELIALYRQVPKRTPGALEGLRKFSGKYYVLDESKAVGFMGEMPSSPDQNAGLFAAASERGEMLGMFFGHDHTNGFHGKVGDMQLGYAPSAGFNAYGPGRKRGVRVFNFHEDDLQNFETHILTEEQLLAQKLPLRVKLQDVTPSSFGAAKPLVRRSIVGLSLGLGTAALAVVAGKLIQKAKIKNRKK